MSMKRYFILSFIFPIFIFSCFNDENQENINQNNGESSQATETKSLLETYLVDEEENPEKLKNLLENGEDPNLVFYFQNSSTTGDEVTALMSAIAQKRFQDCNILLEFGANINAQAGTLGLNPLTLMISVSQNDAVVYLLKKGADPNYQVYDDGRTEYSDGSTALIEAVKVESYDLVKMLLEYGADPNGTVSDNGATKRNDGSPVLFFASQIGNPEIVKALLDAGADPNKPRSDNGKSLSSDGSSPMSPAIYDIDDSDILQLLLSYGGDPNFSRSDNGLSEMSDGTTLLMEAIMVSSLEKVKILVESGADINKPRSSNEAMEYQDGAFPLLLASWEKQDIDIVKYLLKKGADINQIRKDSSKMSSLMTAAYSGNFEAVKILINKDAKINLISERVGTALDCAIDGGHEDIADYLRQHGAIRAESYTEKGN